MVTYLTVDEFKDLQPIASGNGITDPQILVLLTKGSDFIDTYLRSQVKLPLVTIPDVIKDKLSDIVAYKCLVTSGVPITGTDENFKIAHDQALKWLYDVSKGLASLPSDSDQTASFEEGSSYTSSGSSSGYGGSTGTCWKSNRWDC